jgi:hypothetical protein
MFILPLGLHRAGGQDAVPRGIVNLYPMKNGVMPRDEGFPRWRLTFPANAPN